MNSSLVGIFEAFLATIIWGFAFVTLRWAVNDYGGIWVRTLSVLLIDLTFFPFFLPQIFSFRFKKDSLFWKALLPGFALGLCLAFQSIGIRYTSVANSSFITVLNVVLIPFGELFLFGFKPRAAHWIAVALAISGSAFLCGGIPTQWNKGDVITLGCALAGSCHFLSIHRVAKYVKSPMLFNALQVFWASVILLPLALIFEPIPPLFPSLKTFASLSYLAFGSILIGFMLQVRAQRVLSATVASLICLLEAPFASLFALLLLGEQMTWIQGLGAFTILSAALLAGSVEVRN